MSVLEITGHSTMGEVLEAYPSAQRALFRQYHIGGCNSCGYQLGDKLEEVARGHDIGTTLDRHGVAIRAGHHCAQPLLSRLGLAATARASLGCYSTRQDIDALATGLDTVQGTFR